MGSDLPAGHALHNWHALPAAAVAERLATDAARGLAAAEAGRRLEAHGPNALRRPRAEPRWRRFLRQFRELVVGLLLVAAGIAAAMGDRADAAAILAIVVVNAVIGFVQEERAARALSALERLAAPAARVVRDAAAGVVPARELVPGDRIELAAGDHVPADARLVEAFALAVQESALTGESTPVAKAADVVEPAAAPLAERRNMVHAGTVVAAGRAAAVVVATGMATELGRIAGLLERGAAEPTPLQRRLAEVGRVLIVACLAVVAAISLLEVWRGGGPVALWRSGGLGDVLLRAVSLAVAAVPEGLPAVVTLVLAIGVQRMAGRNALVRRLPSVETLGSVTVICSDKTGTLTRNEMTVRDVVTAAGRYHVTGAGYEPRGEFIREADAGGSRARDRTRAVDVAAAPDLRRLLEAAARCTNATVEPAAGSGWRVTGDPTEGALVVAALKGGVAARDPAEPVTFEIPFDADRRRMSVVVRRRDGSRAIETKGAPEAVLPRCVAEWRGDGPVPLTDGRRAEILAAAAGMADRAIRVLAVACRDLPADEPLDGDGDRMERGLAWLGLAGMIDPPREEARRAVQRCRSAGIRPVMISGDHPATALAIARELGIAAAGGRAMTGVELDGMTDDRLAAEVGSIPVYARVSAEHKLRVVEAWQRAGAVVAMTGDGVNDAPAVRAADIGIAMGVTGTDVTKEASDMVLTDDNFASIVAAVEEGRGIYDNVRKFMHYLLACNAGEVLVMLVAAVLGWPAPLAAIQILWLNLVTDGLPALALGVEPPERDLMRRPPRPPHEPVIPWREGVLIVVHGSLVAAVTLGGFWWAWRGDPGRLAHARMLAFCVAAFAQLFFAIGCRSERRTAPEIDFLGNPWLLAAILVSGLLQVAAVALPVAQPVFEVAAQPGADWPVIMGLALVPVTVVEVAKWFRRPPLPLTPTPTP
ncbi:MAG: cation-translocating P-type ATPase [Planctomycetaceae bacterium]